MFQSRSQGLSLPLPHPHLGRIAIVVAIYTKHLDVARSRGTWRLVRTITEEEFHSFSELDAYVRKKVRKFFSFFRFSSYQWSATWIFPRAIRTLGKTALSFCIDSSRTERPNGESEVDQNIKGS